MDRLRQIPHIKAVVFWAALAYSAQWLHGIYALANIPSEVLRYAMDSSARPFITLFFALCLYLLSENRPAPRAFHRLISFKFLIIALVFMAVEAFHFPRDYTLFKQFKYLFYSKLISSLVTCALIMFIFELFINGKNKTNVISALIHIISLKAVLFMVLSILMRFKIIPGFMNNILFNSSQSYLSMVAIVLVLFWRIHHIKDRKNLLFILCNTLPMLLFECRGASVANIIVILFFFGSAFRSKLALPSKKWIAVLGCTCLLSILHLNQINPLGVTALYRVARISSPPHGEDAPLEAMKSTAYKLRYVLMGTPSKYGTLSVFFTPVAPDTHGDTDDMISSISRKQTILLGIRTFLEAPIMGIGSHAAYKLNIEGAGIHSLLPLVLAGYGLVGFIPLALFCLYMVWRFLSLSGPLPMALFLCALALISMALNNSFEWFYALIALFFWYHGSKTPIELPVEIPLWQTAFPNPQNKSILNRDAAYHQS